MDLFSKTNHLIIIETDQYNHVPFEVPFMKLLNYYSLFDIGKEINIQFYISFRNLFWVGLRQFSNSVMKPHRGFRTS